MIKPKSALKNPVKPGRLMSIAERFGIRKPAPRQFRFANKASVRNTYETVDPVSGELDVTHNNYEAQTGNKERLVKNVWTTNNPQSSAVRAQRSLGINSGLGPALSSVGNDFLGVSRNNIEKMHAYKKKFGSKWVEAMSEREQALNNFQHMLNDANNLFNKGLKKLEMDFLASTGLEAPSVIEKAKEIDLEGFAADYAADVIDFSTYEEQTNEINRIAEELHNALPQDKVAEFMHNVKELRVKLQSNADKARAQSNEFRTEFRKFTPGEPLVLRNRKRSVANRLANAQRVFNEANAINKAKSKGKKGGVYTRKRR